MCRKVLSASNRSRYNYPFKRGEFRIWRDPWLRHRTCISGFVGGTRTLERGVPLSINHFERSPRRNGSPPNTLVQFHFRTPRTEGLVSRVQSGTGDGSQL